MLLPAKAFYGLAKSTAGTLKEFLNDYAVAVCELDDPGLDLDLDRPEDYLKALELAGKGT